MLNKFKIPRRKVFDFLRGRQDSPKDSDTKILRSDNSVRKGFTLMEVLVSVAIIGMLAAMFFPALYGARDRARRANCINNLHQLMLAETLYAGEWGDFLPGPSAIIICDFSNTVLGERATLPTTANNPPKSQAGLLAQGGYIADPKIWLCASAQAQNPHVIYNSTDWGRRTYDYTVSEATYVKPYTGSLVSGQYDRANFVSLLGDHRLITTFPGPEKTVVLVEENTGLVPTNCARNAGDDTGAVINDPFFCVTDIIEPRHVGASTAGCLDGHVIIIPCGLCENRRFQYNENGPKMIHLMPEYCPFRGWTAGGF